MALTPQQSKVANQLFSLGRQSGLNPRRAAEFVAAAYAESGLNPRATNKSSGAAGLFQLLSQGYRSKAQKLGGVYNPQANAQAILPDYVNYWKTHPGAAPGAAGRDVERSGQGAGFYANPLKVLGQLQGGRLKRGGPVVQQAYQNALAGPTQSAEPYETAWSLRALDAVPLGGSTNPGENFAASLVNSLNGGQMSTEGMIGAIMQLRSDLGNQSTVAPGYSAGGLDDRLGALPTPAPVNSQPAVLPSQIRQQTGGAGGSPVPKQYLSNVGASHPTSGLEGYPAHDYFGNAGSPVVAPVSGTVVRLSGHDPAAGPTQGVHGPFGWSVYIQGDNGRTYYLTHLGSRAVQVGQKVQGGTPIGTIGNYAKYGGANHVHMGVH